MYYLGISGGFPINELGHDPAACLVKEDDIVAFAEEERFIRVKHAKGTFPINAIKYCLKKAGISLKDVEKVGYYLSPSAYWRTGKTPKQFLWNFYVMRCFKHLPKLFKLYFNYIPSISFIEHHVCHTYSSFTLSGFKKAISFSIDGAGERTSTLITVCKKDEIEKVKELYVPNSLGQFYGQFTEWLGFKINDGEGKTMGLAPYGEPKYDLSGFAKYENGIHKIKWDTWKLYEKIEEKFGPRRQGALTKLHKDVAASVQKTLEDIVLKMVEFYKDITGYKNLCLAGGIALNCKMNGFILSSGLIKDIFIQPAANDAGCAIGAAVYLAMQAGYKFKKLEHIYYGPEFTNEEIERELKVNKIRKYEYHEDIAGLVAELLEKGKIVACF
jgi:carbamoyltransferase